MNKTDIILLTANMVMSAVNSRADYILPSFAAFLLLRYRHGRINCEDALKKISSRA